MRNTLIVEPEGRAGHENMRRDYLLLRAAQEEVLFVRLYRWNPGCVSFGRNEPARRRYNRRRIGDLGLDTVRRPTGGRAVWHEHEVTYCVAGPVTTFGSLGDTYIFIHEMLVSAMARLGIDAQLARKTSRAPGLESGACFASPVGGEVVVDGKKLIGSAQIREGNTFLQHGSILLEDGQDVIEKISNGSLVGLHSTSIRAVTGERVGFDAVATAVVDEVMESWTGQWKHGVVPEDPDASKLDFADAEWTWRR